MLYRRLIFSIPKTLVSNLGKRLSQQNFRAAFIPTALNLQSLIKVVKRIFYPLQLYATVCYAKVIGFFENVFSIDFLLESNCDLISFIAFFEQLKLDERFSQDCKDLALIDLFQIIAQITFKRQQLKLIRTKECIFKVFKH